MLDLEFNDAVLDVFDRIHELRFSFGRNSIVSLGEAGMGFQEHSGVNSCNSLNSGLPRRRDSSDIRTR
jgi:hypothetical protein